MIRDGLPGTWQVGRLVRVGRHVRCWSRSNDWLHYQGKGRDGGREGSEGQNHKEEKRKKGNGTEEGPTGPMLSRVSSVWIFVHGFTAAYFAGATENAGVENAIRSKMQGWKMREWKIGSRSLGWKMREWKIGSRLQGWKMQEWKMQE